MILYFFLLNIVCFDSLVCSLSLLVNGRLVVRLRRLFINIFLIIIQITFSILLIWVHFLILLIFLVSLGFFKMFVVLIRDLFVKVLLITLVTLLLSIFLSLWNLVVCFKLIIFLVVLSLAYHYWYIKKSTKCYKI